jgi:magnesium/cobalt transport protein CorA
MSAQWTALLDPTPEELREKSPTELHGHLLEVLCATPEPGNEPRPTILSYGSFILGVFVVAVVKRDENVVYYQELDMILTHDAVLTVCKTPPGGHPPYDIQRVRAEVHPEDTPGLIAYHIVDDIAERYLDLVDDVDAEIDELEDNVETQAPELTRQRISTLRHDLLRIRRTLSPTRDAVRRVVTDVVDVETGPKVFTGKVDVAFDVAYEKLMRAFEGLELSRDLLSSVRDYQQAKVAEEQNDIVKRLTSIASLLLFPTFIVGVYGQNFHNIPELRWHYGYALSWGVIIVVTIVQFVYFRRKNWL